MLVSERRAPSSWCVPAASWALLVTMMPAIHAVLLPLALGQTTSNYGTLCSSLATSLCASFLVPTKKVSLRPLFFCAAWPTLLTHTHTHTAPTRVQQRHARTPMEQHARCRSTITMRCSESHRPPLGVFLSLKRLCVPVHTHSPRRKQWNERDESEATITRD